MTRYGVIPLALLWFVLALFHLRPWRLSHGYVYGGDDYGYLAHLSSLVIDHDIDESNDLEGPAARGEYLHHKNSYAAGSADLVLPFYWVGYQLDRATRRSSGLVAERNYSKTWTIVFYLVGQQILAVLGLWFLILTLQWMRISSSSIQWVMAGLLASFLPMYIFRRPMAHVAEFTVSALWLYMLVRFALEDYQSFFFLGCFGMIAGLSAAVRWNDIQFGAAGVLTVFASRFIGVANPMHWKNILRCLTEVLAFALAAVGFFLLLQGTIWYRAYHSLYPAMTALYPGYQPSNLTHSFNLQSWKFLGCLFVGDDWGLFWTAPLIPLGLISLLRTPSYIRTQWPGFRWLSAEVVLLAFVLFTVPFGIVCQTLFQSSYYSYRYLTGTLAPCALLLAMALDTFDAGSPWKKAIGVLLGILFSLSALIAIPFEGNNSSLTLALVPNRFGVIGWDNLHYAGTVAAHLGSLSWYGRALAAGPLGAWPGWFLVSRAIPPAHAVLIPLYEKYRSFQGDGLYLLLSTALLTGIAPLLLVMLGILQDHRALKK